MDFIYTLILLVIGTSFIWGPILIIYLFVRNRRAGGSAAPEMPSIDRDQKWHDYIASFKAVVTTKKEKQLLQALLDGKSSDQYGADDATTPGIVAMDTVEAVSVTDEPIPEPKTPIDNTLLLLYFGAFLLVASVGLFVALGGLDGLVRTVIVAVTAAILYFGGLWLYERNQKLAAAGISFVGSGMIIAPLTGVAWYNLVSDMSGGAAIWLITSLVCIAMYAYAFQRIKSDFIAYLLIGSFVSSVESSVLTIGLPSYGYAWGLIVAGIALTLIARLRKQSAVLETSAVTSASLLVPLSVIGSVALFPNFGSIQLAVTLILAGIYYGLQSMWQPKEQLIYRIAAQVSFVAAVANIVYASSQSLVSVGVSLTAIGIAYALMMAVSSPQTVVSWGLTEIGTTILALAALSSLNQAWPFVAALGAGVLMAVVVWLKQKSDEGLQIAGALVLLLPFVIGQYALSYDLDSYEQLGLSAVSAVILFGLTVATIKSHNFKNYYSTATALLWAALGALLLPALLIGVSSMAAVVAVILAISLIIYKLSRDINWLLGTSAIVFIPVAYTVFDTGFDSTGFSIALLASLLWNVVVSLLTRQSFVRWLVVTSILLTPVAIGGGGLGFSWGASGYSIGYILAMAGSLLARAIARGKLLVSSKVPIASYYTEASQAYIFGYISAGIIGLLISLNTDNSQWLTTALLGVIAAAVIFVSKIERRPDVLAFLPVVLQAAIFSSIRPNIDEPLQMGITALIASSAAALGYFMAAKSLLVRRVSLYTAYVGPSLVFFQSDPHIMFAASLFIAGLVTVHYNWPSNQQYRELSIGVCIAAIHWAIFLAGIQNIHVHSHLLALSLAAFAFWRYTLNDKPAYESYVKAIFLVVTVPLVLQSLGNEAGGYYGLILIAEQVLFMIAGVSLPRDANGQRFLLRWGMWTALAAILFQLKGLGWAFLSLLAIIVIGVAVYRLQKNTDNK